MAGCATSSQLRRAITLNDLPLTRRLLKSNPSYLHNPDFTDKSNTSLHLAAQNGLYDIAVFLIELGHDDVPTVEDDIYSNAGNNLGISINTDGHSPLHLAASNLQTPMVELLCQKFPSTINRADQTGLTPLSLAARAQSKHIPSQSNLPGSRSTIRAAEDTSTIEILLEYGADVGTQDHLGNTCLHNACAWGNLKAVRVLVQAGADPLCSNYAGWRPSYYSLTVQAEVYFKNLVLEYERLRAEEMRIVEERRMKGGGSVRLVSATDDDVEDQQDYNHNDSEEDEDHESDGSGSGSEEFYQSRSRASSSRSATTLEGAAI